MAFSSGDSCPPSHPVNVPELKLEGIFLLDATIQAYRRAGKPLRSSDFVVSTGDIDGYSMHADFVSGWNPDELASILSNCNNSQDIPGKQCPLTKYRNINPFALRLKPTRNMPLEANSDLQALQLGPFAGEFVP